jgi:hypothetical protein
MVRYMHSKVAFQKIFGKKLFEYLSFEVRNTWNSEQMYKTCAKVTRTECQIELSTYFWF